MWLEARTEHSTPSIRLPDYRSEETSLRRLSFAPSIATCGLRTFSSGTSVHSTKSRATFWLKFVTSAPKEPSCFKQLLSLRDSIWTIRTLRISYSKDSIALMLPRALLLDHSMRVRPRGQEVLERLSVLQIPRLAEWSIWTLEILQDLWSPLKEDLRSWGSTFLRRSCSATRRIQLITRHNSAWLSDFQRAYSSTRHTPSRNRSTMLRLIPAALPAEASPIFPTWALLRREMHLIQTPTAVFQTSIGPIASVWASCTTFRVSARSRSFWLVGGFLVSGKHSLACLTRSSRRKWPLRTLRITRVWG